MYGALADSMAGLVPLEAVIDTSGEGLADLYTNEAVIDTFGEGVADFVPMKLS